MNENAGKFAGMTREACREAVVEELKKLGLLVKVEPLRHNVGTCYRCHDNVEPLVSTQWFVKMKPLQSPAIEVAKNKELVFVPERFEKTYLNWMENIRDSVHLPPALVGPPHSAFYCEQCGEDHRLPARTSLPAPSAAATSIRTRTCWTPGFSSALWPFSTPRLAGGDGRPQVLLPQQRVVLRLRHHLLLARAHGLLRHRADGQVPLPRGADARPRARRAGAGR